MQPGREPSHCDTPSRPPRLHDALSARYGTARPNLSRCEATAELPSRRTRRQRYRDGNPSIDFRPIRSDFAASSWEPSRTDRRRSQALGIGPDRLLAASKRGSSRIWEWDLIPIGATTVVSPEGIGAIRPVRRSIYSHGCSNDRDPSTFERRGSASFRCRLVAGAVGSEHRLIGTPFHRTNASMAKYSGRPMAGCSGRRCPCCGLRPAARTRAGRCRGKRASSFWLSCMKIALRFCSMSPGDSGTAISISCSSYSCHAPR
jgi:hypothetical protein